MPLFLFSESEITNRLKTNAEDLTQTENSQDTIMQAELYKQRGLLYLEAILTQRVKNAQNRSQPKERGFLYLEAIKIHASDEKSCIEFRCLAFQCFCKAIALDADNCTTAFCLSKRASLNIAQGKVDAGIVDFVAACKLVKNDAKIWLEYGKALIDLEQFEEALIPLREALILRPHHDKIHDLIKTVIQSDRVSENCLDDIKALMAVARTLNTGLQKDSGLNLWLQVVQAGNKDFMSYLAPQINTQMHDGMGNTALHYAARAGYTDLIRPLVKNYKINPNVENRDGLTPLTIALRIGNVALIQGLVDVGAKYSGARLPLVAFENFPLSKTNVFATEKTKETEETKKTRGLKRTTTSETEEETEEATKLKRTTSFRVF